jgi:hypothetical protein
MTGTTKIAVDRLFASSVVAPTSKPGYPFGQSTKPAGRTVIVGVLLAARPNCAPERGENYL